MSLRIAVQEQDGKTIATANEVDRGPLSFDVLTNELVKHGSRERCPVLTDEFASLVEMGSDHCFSSLVTSIVWCRRRPAPYASVDPWSANDPVSIFPPLS